MPADAGRAGWRWGSIWMQAAIRAPLDAMRAGKRKSAGHGGTKAYTGGRADTARTAALSVLSFLSAPRELPTQ